VIVADDSVLFREGVARVLRDGGFSVVGQAGNADELLDMTHRVGVDVVVVDIRMPPSFSSEGLVAARQIREKRADVGVLVLSQYVETHHLVELLGDDPAGVGYLLKDRIAEIDEFLDAVWRVGSGGSVVDPALVSQLMHRRRVHDPLSDLTDREAAVLALMAEGRSNGATAGRLHISIKTLETHVRSIFTKLGLEDEPGDHRRVLAVLAYLRAN
jgi:DNA-binding NarL/FixJ family response regulator